MGPRLYLAALSLLLILTIPNVGSAEKPALIKPLSEEATDDTSPPTPIPTPTTIPTPLPKRTLKTMGSVKVLEIHKPMPPPGWGKVIQYRKDQIFAFSEKNQETLYEFIFQDEENVIRTAVFHENAAGEGYWEVLIWDQP
jgi:hypothetical protein